MALLLLMMSMVMNIQAGEKICRVCGGLGHAFGNSDIECSSCHGRGRVPMTADEERKASRERENYADNANDMMEQNNLTPEEYFAFEELMKQAMTQQPVYQECHACGGTGNCRQCGGYMNVSLDGPLCMVCSGSGICIACRGAGKTQVGYQDNPNKEQLVKRAQEILENGRKRSSSSNNYNNPGNYQERNDNNTDTDTHNYSNDFDEEDDELGEGYSDSSSDSGINVQWWHILAGIVGVGGLGWLLGFRKK